MGENNTDIIEFPGQSKDILTEVLKSGEQQMLAQAIKAEVASYIEQFSDTN